MRILLVEDDETLAEIVSDFLHKQHYVVDVAIDGELGWNFVVTYTYDLIVLDVMLPKLDGMSLCRQIRSAGHQMPVLLLTAKQTSDDKVMGLDVGADDYLVKPVDLQEMGARIRALLRRSNSALAPLLTWGELCLDPSSCTVTYSGKSLNLSGKEYSLLELFMRNARRVLNRNTIIDHLWAGEDVPLEDTVKAHIKGLRRKFRAVGAPVDLIENIYGLGYRLKPLDASSDRLVPQIIAAGLSPSLLRYLETRLVSCIFVATDTSAATIEALNTGNWQLLVLDQMLLTSATTKLLSEAYSRLLQGTQSVIYCLESSQVRYLPRKIAGQLLFSPFMEEELAQIIANTLHLSIPSQPSENFLPPPLNFPPEESVPSPELAEAGSSRVAKESIVNLKNSIADFWEKFKDKIWQRIHILEAAKAALLNQALTPELREQAISEAHKLAGSLGTFGFPTGTNLSRRIENILITSATLSDPTSATLSDPTSATLSDPTSATLSDPKSATLSDHTSTKLPNSMLAALSDSTSTTFSDSMSTTLPSRGEATPTVHLENRSDQSRYSLSPVQLQEFIDLLADLKILLNSPPQNFANNPQNTADLGKFPILPTNQNPRPNPRQPKNGEKYPSSYPYLLIVEDDQELAAGLSIEANSWGMQVEVIHDLTEARSIIATNPPDLVLLDLVFPEVSESGLDLLQELSAKTPPIPTIILTFRDNFPQRLEVARLGACGFLSKPVAPSQVMQVVSQVLQQNHLEQFKVMVVDDDPQILAVLSNCLRAANLQILTLEDSRNFWENLEAFTPDLLVLDINMPYVNGLELCRVIRNDTQWNSLPVLFISGQGDPSTILQVFGVGADDFISKPFSQETVMTRILNRLQRLHVIRSLSEVDLLTGIANRRKFAVDWERLLRLAARNTKYLCLAILDLDNFKDVNDRYGHEMGDRVLHDLGKLLQRSFRQDDLVARWGGEEFVISWYGISKQEAAQRLEQVLYNLRGMDFVTLDNKSFRITFSAGVVQYPEDGNNFPLLYHQADHLLYQAKQGGRNRVMLNTN
jgi:diguanylate cyclase (GGDEF)-like protein